MIVTHTWNFVVLFVKLIQSQVVKFEYLPCPSNCLEINTADTWIHFADACEPIRNVINFTCVYTTGSRSSIR